MTYKSIAGDGKVVFIKFEYSAKNEEYVEKDSNIFFFCW